MNSTSSYVNETSIYERHNSGQITYALLEAAIRGHFVNGDRAEQHEECEKQAVESDVDHVCVAM